MQPNNKQQSPPQQPRTVEIVHAPQQEQPTDIDMMAVMERRNEMMSRILDYAIKSTHPGQWFDQNGKPWPGAAAAEVMARRCAVSIKSVQTNKVPSSDDKGPFYMYVVTATASLPGGYDSIEAIGTCSSRDTFLGTETRAGRNLSDIDEGNILKAAYSNMMVNAVTRLLGVRNLSWDRLASLGIGQESVAKVEYRSGTKGGGEVAHGETKGAVVPFGKKQGTPIADLDAKSLDWYLAKAKESVAKGYKKDAAWAKALEEEIARRG